MAFEENPKHICVTAITDFDRTVMNVRLRLRAVKDGFRDWEATRVPPDLCRGPRRDPDLQGLAPHSRVQASTDYTLSCL
jgi:hypothetical protein